jgi:hypothetical protein
MAKKKVGRAKPMTPKAGFKPGKRYGCGGKLSKKK